MAASRARRSNAGNKMASLLDSEEVDEFYSTTYGGFDEEAEDKEYTIEPLETKPKRYDIQFLLIMNYYVVKMIEHIVMETLYKLKYLFI